jgi:3-phenylpropionate/trans-cinnamate dioxygenase ferredoxin subunit
MEKKSILRTIVGNEQVFYFIFSCIVSSVETLLRQVKNMGFVKVALTKDLGDGEMLGVEAGGKEIMVANLQGKYSAIGNRCTHMSCLLSDGAIMGENVTCPCHGSVFDTKTGKVVRGPAKKPEPVFQIRVEGDQVLVDI